ncbi:flagellar basal-body rod protein FlgG [Vibrio ponticus]|nr:flagellar basal-body rod protein FlgG [Vibrio ponticus]
MNQAGGQSSQNTELPSGLMLGAGSKVVATQKVHTNGNAQTTTNALDMMVEGDGFFQILMPDGNIGYSRNGQFTVNDEGVIVTSGAGYALEPEIASQKMRSVLPSALMVKCQYVYVVSKITKLSVRSRR